MEEKKQSEISKRLQTAIVYLFEEKGRGTQAKLSRDTGVNPGYLSSIVNGKPASDDVAEQIARFFEYTHEEMLRLGRWLLDGHDPKEWVNYRSAVNWNKSNEWPEGKNYQKLLSAINRIPDADRGHLLTIIDRFQGWDDYLLEETPNIVVLPTDICAKGFTYVEPGDKKQPIAIQILDSLPPGFSAVPKYKAVLSGGPGSLEDSDQIEANMMFRTEFLQKKGSINQMALFVVSGDSMAPFIHHKDVVLVDRSTKDPKEIVDGKTYAFQENGTVKVKRLSKQGTAIISSSDNHMMYPPYHIDLDMFHLIGKVVWVGHEVK